MTVAHHELEARLAVEQWEELCHNQALADLPYKTETTRSGQIIMSPASNWHCRYQTHISHVLEDLMPTGISIVDMAVLTSDRIKSPDVVWITRERYAPHDDELCLPFAPEICVEVMSPSNSQREIEEKKRLYFEAGAQEVWICNRQGAISFYAREDGEKILPRSPLCPNFPVQIK